MLPNFLKREKPRTVLQRGGHKEADKQFCAMELVAYLAGEEWTDQPQCADPLITNLVQTFNDTQEPYGTDIRAQLLERYVPRVLDSRDLRMPPEHGRNTERKRLHITFDHLARVMTPLLLFELGVLTPDLVDLGKRLRDREPLTSERAIRNALPLFTELHERSEKLVQEVAVWRSGRLARFTASTSAGELADLAHLTTVNHVIHEFARGDEDDGGYPLLDEARMVVAQATKYLCQALAGRAAIQVAAPYIAEYDRIFVGRGQWNSGEITRINTTVMKGIVAYCDGIIVLSQSGIFDLLDKLLKVTGN